MAASPKYKVLNPHQGEYVAACKYTEDAAALVAAHGTGAKIKYRHTLTVWEEGKETQPASESYDFVADTIEERIRQKCK